LSFSWLRPKPSSFSLISSSYSDPESAADDIPIAPPGLEHTDPSAHAPAVPRPSAGRVEVLRSHARQAYSDELPLYNNTNSVPSEYTNLSFPIPAITNGSEAATDLFEPSHSQQPETYPEQYDDDVALAQALQESLDVADVRTRAQQAEDDTGMARAMHQELLDADLRLRQQEEEDQLLAMAMEQSLVVAG